MGLGVSLVLAFLSLDHMLDLGLGGFYPRDNLLTLQLLKGVDLVQFPLQLSDEAGLVIVRPCLSVATLAVDVWFLEGAFKVIIANVMPIVVLDEGLLELLAESARDALLATGNWATERGWSPSTNFMANERAAVYGMDSAATMSSLRYDSTPYTIHLEVSVGRVY